MPGEPRLAVAAECPSWYDRTRCAATDPGGAHRSPQAGLILDDQAVVTAVAHLVQQPGSPPPGPMLAVEFHDRHLNDDDGIPYVLFVQLGHARGLAQLLRSVAAHADQ